MKIIGVKSDMKNTAYYFKGNLLRIYERIWFNERGLEYSEKNYDFNYFRYMVKNLLILHKANDQKYILMVIDRNYNRNIVQNIINKLGYQYQAAVGPTHNTGNISDIVTYEKPMPTYTEYSIKLEDINLSNDQIENIVQQTKKAIKHDRLNFKVEKYEERIYSNDQSGKYESIQKTRLMIYVKPGLSSLNFVEIN